MGDEAAQVLWRMPIGRNHCEVIFCVSVVASADRTGLVSPGCAAAALLSNVRSIGAEKIDWIAGERWLDGRTEWMVHE